MTGQAGTIAEIRSMVCNQTLAVMLVFGALAAAASLTRIVDQGWLPIMGFHVLLVALMAAAWVLRNRLSYPMRAGFLVALQMAVGAGAVFSFGQATGGAAFFVGASVMAACLFGLEAGAAVSASSLAVLWVAFDYWTSGAAPVSRAMEVTFKATTWVAATGGIAMSCAGPIIAVTQFAAGLERSRLRAEKSDAAKSDFLATVSHELRTPLTGIIGIVDLFQQQALPPEQRRWTDRLAQCARTLSELLNDILDFSKIEAGQLAIERTPFALAEIISSLQAVVQPLADAKRLALEWRGGNDMAVVGDPTRVRQVLTNLIGNAIKFTEQGAVSIAQRHTPGANGAILLTFEVADTGIGMPEDVIARLFAPFVQGDAGTTRRFGGTGLGLAISRKLARAMGGDIAVTSTPGVGSIFTFTVPVREARPDELQSRGRLAERKGGVARRKARILAAEDVDTTRELIVAMLSQMGHEVDTAVNGLQAVEKAGAKSYDLILMDMQMPVMDGLSATSAIRGKGRTMPIVALTANVAKSDHEAFRAAGANVVLSKPVDWRALGAEIERQLHGSASGIAQPVSSPESGNILDEALVGQILAAVGAGAMTTLLQSFRNSVRVSQEQLVAALDASDLAEVRKVAHGIKGAALQFGAVRAGAVAKFIERDAAGLDEVRAALPRLAAEVAAADEALTAYLARTAQAHG